MHELPHHYHVDAEAEAEGNVLVSVENLPILNCAPPIEFDGPGNQWSPEHLLTASVANCFILTFRAVANASKLEWHDLEVNATGTLDKVERTMKFTAFTIKATLGVPEGTDPAKAQRAMERAEANCMITASLSAETHLEANVVVGD